MSMRKGVLKSFDSGTYTATVQLGGSYKVYLESIAVARNLPSAEMASGGRWRWLSSMSQPQGSGSNCQSIPETYF